MRRHMHRSVTQKAIECVAEATATCCHRRRATAPCAAPPYAPIVHRASLGAPLRRATERAGGTHWSH
eukprot:3113412-Prymnesium_polylepis.1